MVDNRDNQHRPRTTRELSNRLQEAAQAAGADVQSFHDALGVATAYFEAASGTATCPWCGGDLDWSGSGRFNCTDCPRSPIWTAVVLVDESEIQPPPRPKYGKSDGTNTQNSLGTHAGERAIQSTNDFGRI